MKNYGTNTDAKSLATMGDLADSKSEANHSWGGRIIENDVSPIDAACLMDMGANRLMGFPTDRVLVECRTRRTDAWASINSSGAPYATYDDIANLLAGERRIKFGGTDTTNVQMGLRITIKFSLGALDNSCLYCIPKKLMLKVWCGGVPDMRLKISGRKISDVTNGVDTWIEIADFEPGRGDPSWVSVPMPDGKSFGGLAGQQGDHQYGELRIEMYSTSTSVRESHGAAGIGSIRLIAPTMYYSSYDLAANNLPYKIDQNGAPVFGDTIVLSAKDALGNVKFATISLWGDDGILRVTDALGTRTL